MFVLHTVDALDVPYAHQNISVFAQIPQDALQILQVWIL